jgi:hypothetical protein
MNELKCLSEGTNPVLSAVSGPGTDRMAPLNGQAAAPANVMLLSNLIMATCVT